MRLKALLSISLAVLILPVVNARPAAALTNLFVPVAGTAFQPAFPNTASQVQYVTTGDIVNATATSVTVTASIGHAQGGANNFTVYGKNVSGQTLFCQVFGTNTATGAVSSASGSTTTVGSNVSFVVATNFPSVDTTYVITCVLAANTMAIHAVVPNH